jgi:hypothetical protein
MHVSRVRPPVTVCSNIQEIGEYVTGKGIHTCKDLCFVAIKKTIMHFGLFPYDYILGTMYKGISPEKQENHQTRMIT